jgi:hypothetical protein
MSKQNTFIWSMVTPSADGQRERRPCLPGLDQEISSTVVVQRRDGVIDEPRRCADLVAARRVILLKPQLHLRAVLLGLGRLVFEDVGILQCLPQRFRAARCLTQFVVNAHQVLERALAVQEGEDFRTTAVDFGRTAFEFHSLRANLLHLFAQVRTAIFDHRRLEALDFVEAPQRHVRQLDARGLVEGLDGGVGRWLLLDQQPIEVGDGLLSAGEVEGEPRSAGPRPRRRAPCSCRAPESSRSGA